MESNAELPDPADQLRLAERAEAAPYVDYPPTPGWYPLVTGLWSGALVVAIAGMRHEHWWGIVGLVLLLAAECLFLRWYSRYHGALPSLRHPPTELRGLYVRFLLGAAAVVGACALTWLLAGPWVAAVVVAALVGLGVAWYERAYAGAAARVRVRLA